ncbi:nitrate- and nitrite sensing domain-containing protein [Streptomyces chumphonensis]|uniref:histidine kinase n=1 Tax=Streptomyces chumphonensis TaxID=1214925 RepID=A0A927F1W8_9ACTN|nr:nitrate- and nitrite sensing domain-containing protein [Streptomyces chumphonensis]MBD3933683.1 nitrate- and nitrite sensing domain-containing protein [Streptomyces chumphonensis]
MQRLRGGRRQRQDAPQEAPGRRARVRNRLLASVALCTVAVVAAGVPSIVTGTSDVAQAQDLVDRAETARLAVSLAHAVADERDDTVRALAERGADRAPDVPEAEVPGAAAPDPGLPDPGVTDPDVPDPGVPDPGVPDPGVPDPGVPGTATGGTGVPDPGTPGGTGTPGATGTGTSGAASPVNHTVRRPGAVAAGDEEADAASRSRVDRKVAELRPQLPSDVRALLDRLPELRQEAEAADGGAKDAQAAHSGYTDIVLALGGVAEAAARELPARAGDDTAAALPHLGRAVAQASATRGLLLGVLTEQDGDSRLASAAQAARVREQGALADFERLAPDRTRETFGSTVNGTDVTTAETYLDELADRPELTDAELDVSPERVASALTTRIDRMRGVHSALAGAEVARLEQLRDDDVTALQLRIALLGAAVLLAAGAGISAARSMARPLAAVRRGSMRVAADPVAEEPVRYTGRNDEFADVVRAVNTLRDVAAGLDERARTAGEATAGHDAERDRLGAECTRLRTERDALRAELTGRDGAVHGTFVQLALRSLGLVERQLALIESMEEKEAEPERLKTLFTLDHMATRMRRHGENLLLLAGSEHAAGHQPQPVPLLDVLRASLSEIERYERVELTSLPPHAQVSGFAADDVSHLVAELLDNATSFSPPDARVELSGWLLENGEVMLSVQDEGIGMAADRLVELNERLGEPGDRRPPEPDGQGAGGLGLGLYVVARLAARHGIRVQLRPQRQGGITAVAVLPRALLPDRPAPGVPGAAAPGETPTGMPGSVAEANSNALPPRPGRRLAARRLPDPAPGNPGDGSAPDTAPAAPAPEGRGPAPGQNEPAVPAASAPPPAAVRLPAQPAEPDEHARAVDEPPPSRAESGEQRPAGRRLTDKGLPKRTPHLTSPPPRSGATGAPDRGGVTADELRKRLGGFQSGARQGLREAAARIAADEPSADRTGGEPAEGPGPSDDRPGADDMGGTEEARQ